MRARLVLGAVALALVLPTTAASAETAAPDAVGWWTRRAGAVARGDGGFELSTGVQGDESVAAVRATVPDDAGAVRIVVAEAAGTVPAGVGFHACPAAATWEPADAGAWDARPAADCDAGRADATPAGPGRWALDVTALVTGGTVDVVVLPTASEVVPGLGASFGFTAAFTGTQVVADLPSATSSPPVSTPVATRTGPAAAGSEPTRAPAVAAPVARPTPAPSAPTTAPGAADGSATSTPSVTVPTPTFDLVGAGGDDRPWGRLLLLVPLSAVAGVVAAAGRNKLGVAITRHA